MKKIFFTILFLCNVFICDTIFSNDISKMLIDVKIQNDGRFRILETWEGNFSEGTENYKSINTSKVSITDFQVGMLTRKNNDYGEFEEFTYDPNYDINASFDEKKNRCGINVVGNSVELCFGITEYGHNTYVLGYTVDPGVVSFDDYDGFNHMFVNPGLNTPIKLLSTRIMLQNGTPLSTENARVWAFGSDNGKVNFNNGSVICDITNYRSRNYQTIMLRLDKGIINPSVKRDGSFTDVQSEAFVGSDYNNTDDDTDFIFSLYKIIIIGVVLTGILVLINNIRNHIEKNDFYKNAEYFRDNPNKNDIALNYALTNDFYIGDVNKFNLIGALILKMINEKNLEHTVETSVGFFGVEKRSDSLKLSSEPTHPLCKNLYKIIENAAGSDRILQEKELSKYAEKNGEVIEAFVDTAMQEGRTSLYNKDGYKRIYGTTIRSLTDVGKECLSEVYGLRKYLDDYTLINERGVEEIEIWDNYLMYAQIFGIGKKVINQLKKLYPESITKIETYEYNMNMSYIYFRSLTHGIRRYNARQMSSSEISGFGGSMSSGGGGGFSGGGFGGGSR